MTEDMETAGSVLIAVSAVLAVAVVVLHHLVADWHKTESGRHVFAFEAALAASLTLWAIRLAVPTWDWVLIARLIAFATLPVVLAWRIRIIVLIRRRSRRRRKEASRSETERT
ncbi:putative phage holin [Nonomuraea antimicrobica]|uniref:putative phage holin n=1 Tax=Nonomuraea antimicrobica TaxID=561173 RepID=UPI0031ED4F71